MHALSSGSHIKSSVPLSHANAAIWFLTFALVNSTGCHHRRVGHRGGSESDFPLNMNFQTWEVRRELKEH